MTIRARWVGAALVAAASVAASPSHAQPREPVAPAPRQVLQRGDVHCVYEDEVGFAWLCSDEGLLRFDGHAPVTFGPDAGPLRAVLRAPDGRFWAAGASGLYEFVMERSAGRDPHLRRVGGTAPAINALVEGRDGSIWCATEDGVLRLEGTRLRDVDLGLPAAVADRAVRVLIEDESGALWAGASSGLYLRTADGRTARFTAADGLPGNDVRALAIDADGRLWAGTRSGLAVIYRGAVERREAEAVRVFTEAHGLPASDVRSLRLAGDLLWIGTRNGTAVLHGFGDDQLYLEDVTAGFAVRAIATTRAGDVWVVTDTGVRLIPGGARSRAQTVITAIRVDGRPEPIPADGVTRAALTVPWRARLVEFEFVNPRAALHAEPPRQAPGRTGLYQVRSGLMNEEDARGIELGIFSSRPHIVRSSSVLSWRGAVPGGIFVPLPSPGRFLNPQDVAGDVQRPPVVLRRSVESDPPSRFDTRHLAHPDLTGWLTLPLEAQRRAVIEYPSRTLDPGRHRFTVQATAGMRAFLEPVSVGRFRGGSAIVEFEIVQAPWIRWWFLAPGVVVVGGLVFAYRRSRARQGREISRMRARIAADLHDGVGASLSRIAMLTEVATQRVNGEMPHAVPALTAIGENARAVIDEMNDAVWFIDPEVCDVRQMLVRVRTVAAALFEPDDVAWRVDASDEALGVRMSSDERRHVYLIVKEALTNARRHARPSSVGVRLLMKDARLRIEIEDDGVGMPGRESGPLRQGAASPTCAPGLPSCGGCSRSSRESHEARASCCRRPSGDNAA